MILIHTDETVNVPPTPGTPEFEADMAAWFAYNQRLTDGGHWIASAALQPTSTATSIRRTSSGSSVVDGPYMETKEQLGGFYLVRADDLDQAIELAEALPLQAGTFEVRPVRFRPGAE